MNGSTPEDPADETVVDEVANVVGEVSRSAEQPSSGRPVTDVARSALARVRQGGAAVGRQGTSLARRTPGVNRVPGVGRAPRAAGRGMRFGWRWLAHEVVVLAPRLPVRDQAKLRAQFPGQSPDELADSLIEGASRASAAVGATIGVWSVLPIAPAFPAEIVTETLTLVGIEIKLIAELHEVYGMGPLAAGSRSLQAAWCWLLPRRWPAGCSAGWRPGLAAAPYPWARC